jgi:PhoH-like ATPase
MDDIKIYALDTNVLIHDPNSLFKFEEHDVLIPMVVLEELDKLKTGHQSVAADARQAVRVLDSVISDASPKEVAKGINIYSPMDDSPLGRLMILMPALHGQPVDARLPGNINDNQIINELLALQKKHPKRKVVLVTKDINMRLKAKGAGLESEDYHNDQLVSDIDRLTKGFVHVDGDFWARVSEIEAQDLSGASTHTLNKELLEKIVDGDVYPSMFIYDDMEFVGLVRHIEADSVTLELMNSGFLLRQKAWGLTPRDLLQAMSMYLLLDEDVDLVALNGPAGSGKTILALACALEMAVEQKRFKRIIATRSTRGLDEDIGFLPGSETEKMTPWLGAFTDNLEALHADDFDPEGSEEYIGENMPIYFKALNFVRGRSFQQTLLIVDEAQNLTPHQIKTIITRAGEGTKVVCLGNLAQIDTPYLGATSSGLTYMSERFKDFDYGGSITLKGVARSRLAAYAEKYL